MSIAFVTRGMVLLVLTALAGIASSLLSWLAVPAYGARGAIFGAMLGLGVLVTDQLSAARFRRGQYPDLVMALVVAVLTGLAAASVLLWHGNAFPPALRNGDFPRPTPWLTGGPLLAVSILYTVLLHGVYAARGLVKRPNLIVLVGSTAAGVVCGILRAYLAERTRGFDVDDFMMLAFLSGLPFSLFWMLAVRIVDPGWSPQRWAKSITADEGRMLTSR